MAGDLSELDRLVTANKPQVALVEELSSTDLECDEDELGEDDIVESFEPAVRIDVADYSSDLAAVATARTTPDPSATLPGIPALAIADADPMPEAAPIPEAPKTSPVPVASEDAVNVTQPFRRPAPAGPRLADGNKTMPSAQMAPESVAPVVAQAAEPVAEAPKDFTQPLRRADLRRPSSIAPVAIDVTPPPVTTMAPSARRAERTLPMQRMNAHDAGTVLTRMPPKNDVWPWVVAASVAGLAILGGGLAALLSTASASSPFAAAGASHDDDTTPAIVAEGPRSAPRSVELTGPRSAITEPAGTVDSIGAHGEKYSPPITTHAPTEPVSVDALPSVVEPSPHALTDAPSSHSRTTSVSTSTSQPTSQPTKKAAAPAPAPEPAPQPAPPPRRAPPRKAPVATTGVVHVPPPLVVVVVDGQHKRVVNGNVVLSCGAHRIRAGIHETQVVQVPCGGAVSL